MKLLKIAVISGIALVICIASAIIAANVPTTDVDGASNWDNFGIAIWITALVTVPSGMIFLVTAVAALAKKLRHNSHDHTTK